MSQTNAVEQHHAKLPTQTERQLSLKKQSANSHRALIGATWDSGLHVLLFPPEFTGNFPSWGPPLSHFLSTPWFRAHCMKIECSLSFTQGERTTQIDYDQIERPVYFDLWATETTFYMFQEGLTQLPAIIRMQLISGGLLAHLRCSPWCECPRLRSQWRRCL